MIKSNRQIYQYTSFLSIAKLTCRSLSTNPANIDRPKLLKIFQSSDLLWSKILGIIIYFYLTNGFHVPAHLLESLNNRFHDTV